MARVPWELARPGSQQKTLGERNLQVRIVHTMQSPIRRARRLLHLLRKPIFPTSLRQLLALEKRHDDSTLKSEEIDGVIGGIIPSRLRAVAVLDLGFTCGAH